MKRIKGFRLQEESKRINGLSCVLVTRPSKWGNSSLVDKVNTPEQAVKDYWHFLTIRHKELVNEAKKELKGKNLACWCKLDQDCHVRTLLSIANDIPLDEII